MVKGGFLSPFLLLITLLVATFACQFSSMFLVKVISLLPFWFLYGISDFAAFVGRRIVRYRLRVVRRNLDIAFPDKTKAEKRSIEREFYRHFLATFVELFKSYRFTKADWEARFELVNRDELEKLVQAGTPVIALSGHKANWEWNGCVMGATNNCDVDFVYKKVQNKLFDNLMINLRTKHVHRVIEKEESGKEMLRNKYPRIMGMVADQSPMLRSKKVWVDFFNRATAFYPGTNKIARIGGYAVFFVHVEKVKRGYYKLEYKQIAVPPIGKEVNVIQAYASLLEESIKLNPSGYLWSHKRWKYSKAEADAAMAEQKNK